MKIASAIVLAIAYTCLMFTANDFVRGQRTAGFFGLGLTIIIAVIGYILYYSASKKEKIAQITASEPALPPAVRQVSTALPWSMPGMYRKYNYDSVVVAGSPYYDTNDVADGDVVVFQPDPDNEYDSNAVAVIVKDKKIGHLPKNRLQKMYHDFVREDGAVYGIISSIGPDGITMSLGYYASGAAECARLVMRGAQHKEFTLTGNKSEEMQSNIGAVTVGDKVSAFYDYDKDKYLASCDLDIGFFPKSADDMLEGDYAAFVNEIIMDDDLKYKVSVVVFIL